MPVSLCLDTAKPLRLRQKNQPLLEKIRDWLKNPIFSFYDDNSAGIVIDDTDGDGKPVLVAIEKRFYG